MITLLPIRLRLTVLFTLAMSVALVGVGAATVLHLRYALDSAINYTLDDRAKDLQPPGRGGLLAGDADTVVQVLDAAGRVVAATPQAGHAPILPAEQVAAARVSPLRFDVDHITGLPGRARVLATAGKHGEVIIVAADLVHRDRAVAGLRSELLFAFPFTLFVAAIAAFLLAAAALRPVESMRAQAAAITEDTPDRRLPVPGGRDEIARLGSTLNAMLHRLHTALTRERDFVSDASHELRTPLSQLKTELELALYRPRTPEETEAALRSALEETNRLAALAEDLLLLARTDRSPGAPGQLVPVAPSLLRIGQRYQTAAGAVIQVRCPDYLDAVADPIQIERAIANLIDNALHHGRPPIEIGASAADGELVLWVRDHGGGFPPEFLPKAFHRFSRPETSRTSPGTGLGLAIVAAIARHHGGTARAANHPDGGAVISLHLPPHRADAITAVPVRLPGRHTRRASVRNRGGG